MIRAYSSKVNVKFVLLLVAVAIGLTTLYYTNYLVKNLAEREKKQIRLYAKGLEFAASAENTGSMNFLFESIIEDNNSIPVILADENHQPISSKNLELDSNWKDTQKSQYLLKEIESMKLQYEPIVVDYPDIHFRNYIYYKDSKILTELKYYPYIQLVAISIFVLLSYLAFSYSRKSEQNKVWVGMSKETAHQLGTPLSGLMAWTEILKSDERLKNEGVIAEIEKDIARLNTITERFSNIGSLPSYKPENMFVNIENIINYLKDRVGRNVHFSVYNNSENSIIPLNRPLFDWVIENITKNAIDAMGGKGNIEIVLSNPSKSQLHIDITDTGKGIPKSQFKKVFMPGFTTKQRGWGLGLTLAKRIVEEYHHGRIYVKSSELGKGTTFRIELPLHK